MSGESVERHRPTNFESEAPLILLAERQQQRQLDLTTRPNSQIFFLYCCRSVSSDRICLSIYSRKSAHQRAIRLYHLVDVFRDRHFVVAHVPALREKLLDFRYLQRLVCFRYLAVVYQQIVRQHLDSLGQLHQLIVQLIHHFEFLLQMRRNILETYRKSKIPIRPIHSKIYRREIFPNTPYYLI